MEVLILLSKCECTKQLFGIRIERRPNGWFMNWSFKLEKKVVEFENYGNTKIQGHIFIDTAYPGCPYCGKRGFFEHIDCHKITCWDGNPVSICGWCHKNCSVNENTRNYDLDVRDDY